ncbi:Beta-galactosidase [Beutenbergia cavernae DSM 12333]|uniref:Beta-galactosidase n=1 Tax=Beutenbergia cavernae (strain ATCC BAA-8 / DSM 12333 / CCUG 43141 / JCM 11478 / NBRC 16432 / NCIMB 13614 / HKI 0122) TaxID=471853 RepID=C5C1F5_BEUC1|nr:beta-galactosidase [Beutenbergia cavernae]ACQ81565.1 Beta-galactosidase [Beutenbergia cavernae DSM 12333]
MILPSTRRIPYGGDYNPEQWPEEVWAEDDAAFDLAHIDTLTVGVFAWSLTQPREDVYDLDLLAQILDRAHAQGRQVCLATGTGALPPWLARAYPEVCRTDFEGRRHVYGQRHNACPSSPAYRRLAAALAGAVAARFADHPALLAWHVNNEYGGACYCDLCAAEFRAWLRQHHGSLDALNDAWNATFWSHRFTAWEEIVPPNALSEHWRGPDHTAFQGITLDYLRFTSDNLLRTFREEKAAIREHSDAPVTTNFMGMYRPIDYHRWADDLDVVSWDNYPPDERSASRMALAHDLMRGLKGGQPFWLMEQTPTVTASRDVNPLKRPGVMRLWSWQAVAHGGDAVLFFQMRQSRGACEKYHGAVLNHAGRTDTRSFREVAALGEELERLGDALLGGRTPARVALLFDWDSWWAVEISDGPNRHVRYPAVLVDYHRALWEAGAQLDVVPVTADLTGYDVVVAPLLHMVKGDLASRLEAVVARGGSVVTTVLSGRVDEAANAFLSDVPGPLARLLGVRVDETDARPPAAANSVTLTEDDGAARLVSDGTLVFDLVIPDGADVVGTYGADFYAGSPAVTRNTFGDGEAWYVGTMLDGDGVAWVVRRVLARHGLLGPYADAPGVEHAVRQVDGTTYDLVLHHGDEAVEVVAHAGGTDLLTGGRIEHGATLTLEPTDVVVLARDDADAASMPTPAGTVEASDPAAAGQGRAGRT